MTDDEARELAYFREIAVKSVIARVLDGCVGDGKTPGWLHRYQALTLTTDIGDAILPLVDRLPPRINLSLTRTENAVQTPATVEADRVADAIDRVADAADRLSEVLAREKRLREALTAVEWVGPVPPGSVPFCPWCENSRRVGHTVDCPRQEVLGS